MVPSRSSRSWRTGGTGDPTSDMRVEIGTARTSGHASVAGTPGTWRPGGLLRSVGSVESALTEGDHVYTCTHSSPNGQVLTHPMPGCRTTRWRLPTLLFPSIRTERPTAFGRPTAPPDVVSQLHRWRPGHTWESSSGSKRTVYYSPRALGDVGGSIAGAKRTGGCWWSAT